MKPFNHILLIFSVLLLGGWSTAYVQDGEYGGIQTGGYSDYMINANTAVVSFHGSSGDSPGKIKRYVMYRCAQVAMNNGYQYFIIASSSNSSENVNVKTKTVNRRISPPAQSTTNLTYPESYIKSASTSDSSATGCDMSATSVCKTHAMTVVIKMFDNKPPANTPRVYYVDDILAHYAP
jgi:hypothetical protein